MYFNYFGLKKNPFRLTPDENFLYLLGGHKNSYAYLKYTALANDGFMLLSGEIGTGKTILLNKLKKDVNNSIKIVSISQTQLQLDDLLRVLLYELTSSYQGSSRAELIIRIKENLAYRKSEGEKILLIIDEAQNLNRECLEEVRLLADEVFEGENLINVILAGQPEIENNIEAYGLEQLKQRIRITYRLSELKQDNIEPYIDFRTYIGFGGTPFFFSDTSLIDSTINQVVLLHHERLFESGISSLIYKYTCGVPRLINALCETSLVLAYGEKNNKVSLKLIDQAYDELGWLAPEESKNQVSNSTSSDEYNIEVSQDGKMIKSLGIDHLPFSIGRDDSNDLVLVNKTVSKKHAIIDYLNNSLIIKDQNSTNGVKINGLKVIAHVISNGEIVQIGRYKLKFLFSDVKEVDSGADTVTTLQLQQ